MLVVVKSVPIVNDMSDPNPKKVSRIGERQRLIEGLGNLRAAPNKNLKVSTSYKILAIPISWHLFCF
jgi:hypothetical protein